MARINITKTAVKDALEAYRGSRKINPMDPVGMGCVNYLRGRRCLVAQVLHDLGVSDDDLKTTYGSAIRTLEVLYRRGVITARSLECDRLLSHIQNLADGGSSAGRLPWGKVVAEVLD